MAKQTTKTWNKGLSKNQQLWLAVFAAREMADTRLRPMLGEFFVESIDENKWCDRIECLELGHALRVSDASDYDSNAHVGVVSNAWGDAAKGILNSKS